MDEIGILMRMSALIPVEDETPWKIDFAVFDSEEELLQILTLRDKVYHFIMNIARIKLQDWEVVQNIKDEEKRPVYLEAYFIAIEHIVRKFCMQFTETVASKAETDAIEFNEEYNEIGSLYLQTINGD